MDVPPQDVITKDNVSVKVNAVGYFRVMDPQRAIVEVENFHYATAQVRQLMASQASNDTTPNAVRSLLKPASRLA